MKKPVTGYIAAVVAVFLCVSCAQSVPSGTNENPSDTTGSISIQLPGTARAVAVSDIDRFSIEITSTPLSYSKTVTGTPGQSVKVDNLAPGSYNVLVNAYDDNLSDANKLVFTGSNGATVTAGTTAAVSIALSPAVGDLSVTVTFPADPSTVTRQRFKGFKSDYSTTYATYDTNGVITRIDFKLYDKTTVPFGYKPNGYTIFQFNDAQTRTGAKTYDSTGTQTGYATIDHDGSGNETAYSIFGMDDKLSQKITATYNASNTAIIELKQENFGSDGITVSSTTYRRFYDNGDLKSTQSAYGVWLDEMFFSTPTNVHIVQLTYDPTTRVPVKFEHYADGVLTDTEIRTLSPSGFYQKAEHKREDGTIISSVVYGNPIDIGDYYAQPATRIYLGDPNSLAKTNYESSRVYYQLFTKTFQPAGSSIVMTTFETGTVKAGIINPLYFDFFGY